MILDKEKESTMKQLLILGAGGFGQMAKETALELGYEQVVFLDDAADGEDVIGRCCDYILRHEEYPVAVAAFGNNKTRLYWTDKLLEAGYQVPALVHPSAVVSPSAVLESGCFVMQRAVVNTHTRIERAALINSGAVVDHDSVVCAGAHVGLGSIVKANCTIESGRKVEAGEVIFSTRRKIEGADSRSLEDAVYAFGFGPQCSYVKPFGEGHINETYAVYMPGPEGTDVPRYVLQRVNIHVFKNPAQVMENIFSVTEYLREVIRKEGGDLDRETLSYIKTKSGDTYFEDADGQPWRCLHYVPNSICHQTVEEPQQFYQSARSFGHFLKQLGDYPAEDLYETIPRFHDTVKRFRDFSEAVRKDVKNRAGQCREEIDFALAREADCGVLMKQLQEGVLPLRVTHNDTKLNNILFDADTDQGLCIIDLDTIMPGLAANDFGDSIRFGASTAEEDEPDLSKVHFDIHLYELYVKGYLEMARDVLIPAEIDSLPWGARLMTLECGMRFLADYLQGDVYFKTAYPEHNLVRARTQFRLVKEMEEQFDSMYEILRKYS
jgi:acetyltransferase-like isoleucine patch superfamily enzyme